MATKVKITGATGATFTVEGALTTRSATTLSLGTSTATAVSVGASGITTTVPGLLSITKASGTALAVDTNVLLVDATNNWVGVNMTPARALDVTGTFGTTGVSSFASQVNIRNSDLGLYGVTSQCLAIKGNSSSPSADATARLTADGTFATSTGWTANAGWTIGSGVASHATGNTGTLVATSGVTNKAAYAVHKVTFTLATTTAGTGLTVSVGPGSDNIVYSASGTYTARILPNSAIANIDLKFTPGSGGTWVGSIDNVTVTADTSSVPEVSLEPSNNQYAAIEIRNGGGAKYSTFVGWLAGQTNSGQYNSFYGSQTGQAAGSGDYNSAFGGLTLPVNNGGMYNSAFGYVAMGSNTTGNSNAAFGYGALASNYSNGQSTAIGTLALQSSTGEYNTAIGYYSGNGITTGGYNTILGSSNGSPLGITTGTGNTIVGAGVNGLAAATTNNIVLASGSTIRAQFNGTNWTFQGNVNLANGGGGVITFADGTTQSTAAGTGAGAWASNGSNNIYNTNSGGLVAIGNNAPTSRLEVTGTASASILDATEKLTADGTFATSTGWTVGTGWSIGSGVASHATGNTARLSGTSTATSTTTLYLIQFYMTTTTAGSGIKVYLSSTSSQIVLSGTGTQALYMVPGTSSGTLGFEPQAGGTWVGTIDDVHIYPVVPATPDMVVRNSDGSGYAMEFRAGGASNISMGMGLSAGKYSGIYSLFFGHSAGTRSTGSGQTGIGIGSLQYNTTGAYNTAIGNLALGQNITGAYNTAIGYNTMGSNFTGDSNTAIGGVAMNSLSYGSQNTGVGTYVLTNVTDGTANTAIGYNTGLGISSGTGNTIIGANITGLSSGLTDNIILASGGVARATFDGTNWSFTGTVSATLSTSLIQVTGFSVETGSSVSANDPLHISSANAVYKALATGLNYVCGFAVGAAGSGNAVQVKTNGVLSGVLSAATPGNPIYLSASGGFTETAPSTTGYMIQRLGWAKSSTDMLINIGEPIAIP